MLPCWLTSLIGLLITGRSPEKKHPGPPTSGGLAVFKIMTLGNLLRRMDRETKAEFPRADMCRQLATDSNRESPPKRTENMSTKGSFRFKRTTQTPKTPRNTYGHPLRSACFPGSQDRRSIRHLGGNRGGHDAYQRPRLKLRPDAPKKRRAACSEASRSEAAMCSHRIPKGPEFVLCGYPLEDLKGNQKENPHFGRSPFDGHQNARRFLAQELSI